MKLRMFLAIGALAISPAIAQDHDHATHETQPAQQGGMMMQGGMMQGGMMGNMMGMHIMAMTVTALNAKTGLVDANAGGMALKLHFPPASLAGVKVGDKLSVHLGFSKS